MSAVLPLVIFVLGGPGSGKGTQCARIVDKFGFAHLSAGDLLRVEKKKNGELGQQIQELMSAGKIIPAEITVRLLREAIEAYMEGGKKRFLVDGFPRDMGNVKVWAEVMGDKCNNLFTLFMECTQEVMQERLLSRKDGRADDNEATIKKRFDTFVVTSMPIVDLIEREGKLRRIDSSPDPDTVFESVCSLFVKEGLEAPESVDVNIDVDVEFENDNRDYKKSFHQGVMMRYKQALVVDTEAGEGEEDNATPKARQFWDLPIRTQESIVTDTVQEVLFNPQKGVDDCQTAAWSISGATTLISVSGGFHVNCDETRSNGTKVAHAAYINSYGVLERFQTPLIPSSMPAADEDVSCVIS